MLATLWCIFKMTLNQLKKPSKHLEPYIPGEWVQFIARLSCNRTPMGQARSSFPMGSIYKTNSITDAHIPLRCAIRQSNCTTDTRNPIQCQLRHDWNCQTPHWAMEGMKTPAHNKTVHNVLEIILYYQHSLLKYICTCTLYSVYVYQVYNIK